MDSNNPINHRFLTKGYDTINSISMLMNAESLMASSMALAEFHGLCIAFDQSSPIKLRQLFPIFDPSRLMWVQKDMLHFLSKVAKSQKLLYFFSHL
jgi:hypothetical protein